QAESYLEAYTRDWGTAQRPYYWGFLTLELDQEMLQQGKVMLSAASGIFPDGTPFSFDGAQAPAPLQLAENQTDIQIVLALPHFRRGREEVIFREQKNSLARFISFETEVNDFNAMAVGSATLQFGRMRLRLMTKSDLTPEWTALTVVHVVNRSNDNKLTLDPQFIPPLLNCYASPQMSGFVTDIQGLLDQRRQQISQRLLQLGRHNDSEIMDFLLLSLVNRYSGQVSHIRQIALLHPERLFSEWLQFATELATFS
ncbi:type VI secretion system baseplate subunit TssK, partial [Xenorhabdus innexi]